MAFETRFFAAKSALAPPLDFSAMRHPALLFFLHQRANGAATWGGIKVPKTRMKLSQNIEKRLSSEFIFCVSAKVGHLKHAASR